jgi:DNA-directed RNA polymerase subunit beta'
MDLSTGSMVEEGMAIGIIAAQSIGEPGTQLTMRTFHIGGTASREVEESDIKARKGGRVKFARIRSVVNAEGMNVVLARNGEIVILDPKERELERYVVPNGATLMINEDDEVEANQVLCQWDPHSVPILAEVGGRVRLEDCIEGKSMRTDKEVSGHERRTIIEHKGDLHPQIILEDGSGKILDFYYLPERSTIEVKDGTQISAGQVLAKNPREASGTQDITGGLPRVTELFEARKPKDPSIIAEIDGIVELQEEKKRGKRVIIVRGEDGTEVEQLVPHNKHLLCHTGDLVKAGDALVRGPLVPHDILRVSGTEAVQQYLLHEIQNVYRSQRVEIDDKHIEIVISQMLRKIRVENVGDTNLLPGVLMDRFEFRRVNDALMTCEKVTDPGDTEFQEDDVVPTETIQEVNEQLEAAGQTPAETTKPKPASGTTQLLGITKASVQSESFISAASFQETTKVLTEAAIAGKSDYLVGLKENVILGHLIPAGTGFRAHQEAQFKIRPEALSELEEEKKRILAARLDMLNEGVDPTAPQGGSLEQLDPDQAS